MRVRLLLTLGAVALIGALAAGSAFGAIGVYKVSAGSGVPCDVSYMLNTDANDTTGGWSVKIEIVPVGGGPAVRTYTFLWPHPRTLRGMHANAVTWDGYKDDSTPAPPGNYRAVVTAKAAPVTGTDLQPLWETTLTTSTWTGCAVNKNPGSPYEGYVYATNYGTGTKGVYMYEPDGTFVKIFPEPSGPNGWINSAPWGVDISADDKVYATSYSKTFVCEYSPDGSTNGGEITISGGGYSGNPRAFAVTGSGSGFKAFVTHWTPTGLPISGARLFTQSGQPLVSGGWTLKYPELRPHMQPEFDSDGNIHVPAWCNANPDNTGGGLIKFDMAGNKLAENNKIRRGTGLALTPDGQYFWISRFVTTNAPYTDPDPTAFYRIPYSAAYTTADPDTDTDCEKFGINNAGTAKRALYIDVDPVGNIVAATGNTLAITGINATHVGVYAPPDNGSVHARESGNILWIEPQPVYEGDNGPQSVSSCNPSSVAHIEVYVSDGNGYQDIQRCYLDLSPFGLSDHTPMNFKPGSGSGNNATYELDISVPQGTPVGTYELTVYVRDQDYPTVPETEGKYTLIVTGGWITGTVTNSVSGQPIAGATVTATGPGTYSTVTDQDGNYVLSVLPGTYQVNATKASHIDSADPPAIAVVNCDSTTTGINRTLNPMNIYQCAQGNSRYTTGRPHNSPVCVIGTVMRTHAVTDGQNGFNGYYYIWDTSYAGTQQGLKVAVYPGQPALKEGDKVVVDGVWQFPYGIHQGQVVPSAPPYVVSTGNPLPNPLDFYYTYRYYTYGRIFKASGRCLSVGTGRFTIEVPTSPTDPTPVGWTVVADTVASTGATLPEVDQLVDAVGIVSMIDVFGDNVLVAGKAADIAPWPVISDFRQLRTVPNGGVILNVSDAALAPIVTYIDPGELGGTSGNWFWVEAPDRTSGIKVDTVNATYLPFNMMLGDKVHYMKGRLSVPANAGRVLTLSEMPTSPTFGQGWIDDIPAPIGLNVRSFGGGWFGGTPGPSGGVGLNTDGILVRLAGRASGYGSNASHEWFYLDDGSGTPSDPGYTGVKVVRSKFEADLSVDFTALDGKMVIVQGLCSSEWSGAAGARIRVLRIRYSYNDGLNDQVQILD